MDIELVYAETIQNSNISSRLDAELYPRIHLPNRRTYVSTTLVVSIMLCNFYHIKNNN